MENKRSSNFDFGSKTTSIYTERQVRVFAIHEPELDMLSNFNNISTLFFSISTGCFIKALDNYNDSKGYGVYVLFFIISLLVGVVIWWKKRGITNKIKMESKNITKPLV